jgi:hypothetical protein
MTIDLDDYESLPDSLPFVNHMIAGAMAGMVEHGVMYPLDTSNTRMIVIRLNYSKNAHANTLDFFKTLHIISNGYNY